MNSVSTELSKRLKKVNKILISQPEPLRSPYFGFEKKYDLEVNFNQFIHVEKVSPRFFRKQRISFIDYSAVVFNSKNSIDFFFSFCDDIRFKMSAQTKYFCLSQAIANYLQKFIVYRKRKVFVGERSVLDLKESFLKHKDAEKFLIPCNITGSKSIGKFLEENDFNFKEVQLYQTVSSDLSELDVSSYDMIVFFSHLGIESLFNNFPDFEQGDIRVAVFGSKTKAAAEEQNLIVDIPVPQPGISSMQTALDNYLQTTNR